MTAAESAAEVAPTSADSTEPFSTPASALVGAGPITLTLPPLPPMVRVARLTASSVASLTDMTIDDIDDIKIAVSEMITVLIQSGGRSLITLRFEIDADAFTMDASTPATGLDLGRDDLELSTAVLDAVSDSYEVAFVDDRILMRISKTPSSSAPTQA